jgi:hypothetical protein
VVHRQRAYKPRSASTITVQSAGTLPCKWPKRAAQWGPPGAGTRGLDDAPGHGDGTAADDHADRQEGEALPQRRGVHGQRELAAGGVGPGHDPAEQRGKTQGHLQTAPFAAPFGAALVLGIPIPGAALFADGHCGAAQYISQSDSDGRQATGLGEDDAKAPQDQNGQLGVAEMGQIR